MFEKYNHVYAPFFSLDFLKFYLWILFMDFERNIILFKKSTWRNHTRKIKNVEPILLLKIIGLILIHLFHHWICQVEAKTKKANNRLKTFRVTSWNGGF
jgi:hypothetical protein